MAKTVEVYLFPLANMIYFPSTTIPLNIFETRYNLMVKESLLQKTPVAISFSNAIPHAGETPDDLYKKVCQKACDDELICGAGQPHILNEEDGSGMMSILMRGMYRVKLKKFLKCDAFATVEGEIIEETTDLAQENLFRYNGIKNTLFGWIKDNVQNEEHRQAYMEQLQNPPEVIENFTMLLVRDPDLRQMILETNDINDRLETIVKLVGSDINLPLHDPGDKKFH